MIGVPPDPSDKRTRSRLRTLRRGRIFYGVDHALSFDCAIRNITDDGALLRAPATQAVPDAFVLMHVADGVAFEASLRWRRGEDIGVQFLSRHELKGEVGEAYRVLRRVWLALAPE